MKSIMKSFNMENAVLPFTYSSDIINPNGFILTNYHLYNFLKLEVGKKYYTIYHKSIMAFKVLRIVYFATKCHHESICYELKLADGHVLKLDVLTDIYGCKMPHKEDSLCPIYKIFESKEDILEYRKTKDESLIYNDRWSLDDIIEQYFSNEFTMKEDFTFENIDIIRSVKRLFNNYYCKGYFLDKDSSLMSCAARFKYLWIDDCGGHYQVYDMVDNRKVYPTKQEALNTLKVFDFDDEETETTDNVVNVTIELDKKDINDIISLLTKMGCNIK